MSNFRGIFGYQKLTLISTIEVGYILIFLVVFIILIENIRKKTSETRNIYELSVSSGGRDRNRYVCYINNNIRIFIIYLFNTCYSYIYYLSIKYLTTV